MFCPLLFYWNLYSWANIETHMLYVWSEYLYIGCRNPTLRECEDETHSWNWGLGVLRDSRNFKVWLQGSKHHALGRSLYNWRAIKIYMLKMGSHGPFGHLQHTLWQKEGPGVKLAVWFPTIKSQESTRPRCVQVECDTPFESSQRKLQVFFRPHPNWRSEQRVMISQSLKSPNRDNFGTPPWESRDKKPFGCKCYEEMQRILCGGRWWLPPSLGHGESCESKVACGLS